MAAGLSDERHEPRHTQLEMLRQRLYGVLADYEDCNDHDTLRDDPIFKIVADRLPEDDPLASQPTLSRFENAVAIDTLWRTLDLLTAAGVERLREKNGGRLPRRLVLDLDAADDPAHGQQQLALFHGYFGQYQYFPIAISEPTTQHVFYAALRPGNTHSALGAADDLRFVVERLRRARRDVEIHVRGDSGYGAPWMYKICEENSLTYTFGIGANKRLRALAHPLLDRAVAEYERTGEKQRLFTRFEYQADSWDHPRTVIAKAECQAEDERIPAELRTAHPATWRSRVIKVAATVVQSARRIVISIAGQWPHWPAYVSVSRRSGAIPAGP